MVFHISLPPRPRCGPPTLGEARLREAVDGAGPPTVAAFSTVHQPRGTPLASELPLRAREVRGGVVRPGGLRRHGPLRLRRPSRARLATLRTAGAGRPALRGTGGPAMGETRTTRRRGRRGRGDADPPAPCRGGGAVAGRAGRGPRRPAAGGSAAPGAAPTAVGAPLGLAEGQGRRGDAAPAAQMLVRGPGRR